MSEIECGRYNVIQRIYRSDDLPALLRHIADFLESGVDKPDDITYEWDPGVFFVTLYMPEGTP